jgi:hypothetical protein
MRERVEEREVRKVRDTVVVVCVWVVVVGHRQRRDARQPKRHDDFSHAVPGMVNHQRRRHRHLNGFPQASISLHVALQWYAGAERLLGIR